MAVSWADLRIPESDFTSACYIHLSIRGVPSAVKAQSSITSTSIRLSRPSRLRKLPSARAKARSRNSAAAPV